MNDVIVTVDGQGWTADLVRRRYRTPDSDSRMVIAFLDALLEARRSLELYRYEFGAAVDAATPFLQTGGRYAHLVKLGESITADGVPRLVAHLEQRAQQAEQERDDIQASYEALVNTLRSEVQWLRAALTPTPPPREEADHA